MDAASPPLPAGLRPPRGNLRAGRRRRDPPVHVGRKESGNRGTGCRPRPCSHAPCRGLGRRSGHGTTALPRAGAARGAEARRGLPCPGRDGAAVAAGAGPGRAGQDGGGRCPGGLPTPPQPRAQHPPRRGALPRERALPPHATRPGGSPARPRPAPPHARSPHPPRAPAAALTSRRARVEVPRTNCRSARAARTAQAPPAPRPGPARPGRRQGARAMCEPRARRTARPGPGSVRKVTHRKAPQGPAGTAGVRASLERPPSEGELHLLSPGERG